MAVAVKVGAIALTLIPRGASSIAIAFVSYLIWFYLVHAYPVSRLSSFTFLTPVFATVSGALFLQEPITLQLMVSLVLVSVGIYVVNRK